MKNKIIRLGYIVLLVAIILTQYSLASQETLSKDKYAWGFSRGTNHSQPMLDSKPLAILDEFGGIAMGSEESNQIYLTFDSGYEAGFTSKILEILKDNDVTATFFITAHYLNTAEDLVLQMIEDGHDVGNHTPNYLMSIDYKIFKNESNCLFKV